MNMLDKKIFYHGNGYPGYESVEKFHVVHAGQNFEDVAFELLSNQLDKFSDAELLGGVSVQVFLTDARQHKCAFASTDGIDNIEAQFHERINISGVACLAGRWFLVDGQEELTATQH